MNKYSKSATSSQCAKMANGGFVNEAEEPAETTDPLEKANQDFEAARGGTSDGKYGPGNGDNGQDMQADDSTQEPDYGREGRTRSAAAPAPKPKSTVKKPAPATKPDYGREGRRTAASPAPAVKQKLTQTQRDAKNQNDFDDTPLVRGIKSVGDTIKGYFKIDKAGPNDPPSIYAGESAWKDYRGRQSAQKLVNGGTVGYGGQSVQVGRLNDPIQNSLGGGSDAGPSARSYKK